MTPLAAIVFSKDRPLQVEAAIESLLSACQDTRNVTVNVLYLATSAAMRNRYERVRVAFPQVRLTSETGFKETLLAIVNASPHLLFVVDDVVFVRHWSVGQVVDALARNPLAIGYSLRLGRNTVY